MFDPIRREILKGTTVAMLVAPTAARALGGSGMTDTAAGSAQSWLETAYATRPAPAISAAVAGPDGVEWAGAVGMAQIELGVPATPAHHFPLGSISKVITSTLAARLALRGVLDLDAPIAAAMPDLPDQHRQTTLRQLLTHRGGIRHYTREEADLGSPGGAVFMRLYPSDDEVLALFIEDPLVAAPGAEVRYSSYGYTLASMVIAAAAGHPFLDLVETEIAVPFGLPSLKPADPWRITPLRAGQYANDLDLRMLASSLPEAAKPQLTDGFANLPFSNSSYCWAGAGFSMSPSDTAKFGAAMIAAPNSVVTDPERKLLFTPLTQATESSPPLGLGWRVDSDKEGRLRWHHAGATPGGCQLLVIYPDLRQSVAIAGNVMTMKMNLLQAASDLVDILRA